MSENGDKKKGIYVDRNCICTFSPTGYGEIVMYREPFKIPVELGDEDDRAHLRKFFKDEEGYWQARTSIDLIKQDLTLRKCGKRASQKIILYAQANKWEQFITLTFDPKMVNRYDEIECKEKWREFERYCKRTFPDCKLLAVWEYHKKEDEFGARALHFHLLASGLYFPTIPYLNADGSQKVSKSGAPLYILTPRAWPFGFSTVAYLPEDGRDNSRVVNYLTKYVSKYRARRDDGVKMCKEAGNYNAQRYYHTRNLDVCVSSVMEEIMTEAQVLEFARLNGFELHKSNNKMLVLRRFLDGEVHAPIIDETADEDINDNVDSEVPNTEPCMILEEGYEKPERNTRKFSKIVTDKKIKELFS